MVSFKTVSSLLCFLLLSLGEAQEGYLRGQNAVEIATGATDLDPYEETQQLHSEDETDEWYRLEEQKDEKGEQIYEGEIAQEGERLLKLISCFAKKCSFLYRVEKEDGTALGVQSVCLQKRGSRPARNHKYDHPDYGMIKLVRLSSTGKNKTFCSERGGSWREEKFTMFKSQLQKKVFINEDSDFSFNEKPGGKGGSGSLRSAKIDV